MGKVLTDTAFNRMLPKLKRIARQGYCYYIDGNHYPTTAEIVSVSSVDVFYKNNSYKVYVWDDVYVECPYSSRTSIARELAKICGITYTEALTSVPHPIKEIYHKGRYKEFNEIHR